MARRGTLPLSEAFSRWFLNVCAALFVFGFADASTAQVGVPFGSPVQKMDKSKPLYLQGDQLIYDTRNKRVIARGKVEIYYNNHILTADEIIYDQGANTLTARGNTLFKEPNGNITRGDSVETPAEFRDAFIESLRLIGHDDTRITVRRSAR